MHPTYIEELRREIPLHERRAMVAGLVAISTLHNLVEDGHGDPVAIGSKTTPFVAAGVAKELENWSKEQLIASVADIYSTALIQRLIPRLVVAILTGVNSKDMLDKAVIEAEELLK